MWDGEREGEFGSGEERETGRGVSVEGEGERGEGRSEWCRRGSHWSWRGKGIGVGFPSCVGSVVLERLILKSTMDRVDHGLIA